MGCSRFVAIGFLAVCSACSVIIDAEPKQCSTDNDCRARGGQFASSECNDGYCSIVQDVVTTEPERSEEPMCSREAQCDVSETCLDKKCQSRWACTEDAPPLAASGELAVKVRVVPVGIDMVIPNIPGKVCRSLDPPCNDPVAEVVSDEQGVFHLTLPDGFVGYLDVALPGFYPQLYYFPRNLNAQTPLPNLAISPVGTIDYLGAAVGATPDPERGHIYLSFRSCLGAAPGIHLAATKADSKTLTYYVLDGNPSADIDVTTKDSTAGFLNFPPGNTVVKLTSGTFGEIDSISLTVRPGHITSAFYNPASLPLEP